MATSTKTDYAAVWREAKAAGEAAARACTPTPMTVFDAHLDGTPVKGGQTYFVPSGLCGFATIIIKPATSGFARWLKANERTYKHYYGGLSYFVHAECTNGTTFSQSVDIKEAWARAAVKVLRDHGISCGMETRLD